MDARSLALQTLREIHAKDAYADVALDRALRRSNLPDNERRLATELVYGVVRRQRTLDALITHLASKPAAKQEVAVRLLLQMGLYQLRYLDSIPHAAAVHTTVELARRKGLNRAAGFMNGLLRTYIRLAVDGDPLHLPDDPVERLAVEHSYPTWLVRLWVDQFGLRDAQALCVALNQAPPLDIRVNTLRATPEAVWDAFAAAGIPVEPIRGVPCALRVTGRGAVESLPGFAEGWWTVQDGAAQLVAHLLAPRPGETVIDAAAAPGGKTLHIADLMDDDGTVIAVDRTASRLATLTRAVERLAVKSVRLHEGDSREQPEFHNKADRVLLDAPCSGLGTLHRHADARWRQSAESLAELARLQSDLLDETARWVKPGGVMVYSTCTLNRAENETQVSDFLDRHPGWALLPPGPGFPAPDLVQPDGSVTVLPHRDQMDGFYMVKLQKSED